MFFLRRYLQIYLKKDKKNQKIIKIINANFTKSIAFTILKITIC